MVLININTQCQRQLYNITKIKMKIKMVSLPALHTYLIKQQDPICQKIQIFIVAGQASVKQTNLTMFQTLECPIPCCVPIFTKIGCVMWIKWEEKNEINSSEQTWYDVTEFNAHQSTLNEQQKLLKDAEKVNQEETNFLLKHLNKVDAKKFGLLSLTLAPQRMFPSEQKQKIVIARRPEAAFLLISSLAGKITNTDISKQYRSIGGNTKADPLPIKMDIVHLKKIHDNLETCISSSHTQTQQHLQQNIDAILKIFENWLINIKTSGENKQIRFYFSGHGDIDGDLIVETKKNKIGQHLKIEIILQLLEKHASSYVIYLDSCFSGQNLQRAQKFFKTNKRDLKQRERRLILCSSSRYNKSFYTEEGSVFLHTTSNTTLKLRNKTVLDVPAKVRLYLSQQEPVSENY